MRLDKDNGDDDEEDETTMMAIWRRRRSWCDIVDEDANDTDAAGDGENDEWDSDDDADDADDENDDGEGADGEYHNDPGLVYDDNAASLLVIYPSCG